MMPVPRVSDRNSPVIADQAARRRREGEAGLAAARRAHVGHLALALRHLLDDRAGELVVDVDDHRLIGLLAAIGAVAEEDARAADRKLEALAAHRLDQHAELQLAAAGDLEGVRSALSVTRIATLPSASRCSRSRITRLCTLSPSRPA
jgi:hypothetical protein